MSLVMQDIQNANDSEALTIALKKIASASLSMHNKEHNINNTNKIIIPDLLNLLHSKYPLWKKRTDCACVIADTVSFLIIKNHNDNNNNNMSSSMKTATAFRDLLFHLVDDLDDDDDESSTLLLVDNCVQSISNALFKLYTNFRDQTNSNKALVTAADDDEKTRTAFCKLAVNALSARSNTLVCKWMSSILLDNKTRSDDNDDHYYSNIKLSLNRKRIFSHPDVVEALCKLDNSKCRMTPEAFQSLTISVGILCYNTTTMISPFFRADFVSSVTVAASNATFSSKEEASSANCAFLFMMSGLLSSKKMTEQDFNNTFNENNTKSFRIALTRISQNIDSDVAFQYLCSVVHSLTKFREQAGTRFFDFSDDDDEFIAIFSRCSRFASSVNTAASFGKAMVSLLKSGSADAMKSMQQKFSSPVVVNAIVAVARSIDVVDEVSSLPADYQHNRKEENSHANSTSNVTLATAAVKSISSVIVSIVTNNGEGQRLFGTPAFANCWGTNLARWAGDDEATYLCCSIITEISTSSITRPFFATESVVSGFADHLSRHIVNDHTASKFGGAIALLCYRTEECKRIFSRVSVFDAFVRILDNSAATRRQQKCLPVSSSTSSTSNSQIQSHHYQSSLSASSSSSSVGSSATSVHHLCMAVSRLVWNEGPGRDAFSQCPRIVDDFIFVIAPHAKGLSVASQWLFSFIANTAINEKNRRLYFLKQGNEEKLIDLFFSLAPSCRSGEAVYHFCRAFHNLCIEERIRNIFFAGAKACDRMKQLVKIYTDFTRFVFTKDSAALWARSIVELIHENGDKDDNRRASASASSSSASFFFLNPAFKNALCAAIFSVDSAFLEEAESALWYLKLVEILFLNNNDNNNPGNRKNELLTSSFKRAFDTFALSVSKHAKAKVVENFERCGNKIQQELESSSLKNDDYEVNALVKDILSREI